MPCPWRTPFLVFFLPLVALFATDSAHAWPYSFEFGGAMASYSSPAPLIQGLGLASSTSASSGFDVPMTLSIQLQSRQRGLLFSLGLQQRYLIGTSGAGESFSILPTSPVFRIEFWRLVLGAGYTTYVWKDLSFKKASGIDSMMTLEGQFLFPITPEIDFGLQASRLSFTSALYGSGASIFEYGAFFRLNFGMTDAMASERRKFKGWRYPLGSPLR